MKKLLLLVLIMFLLMGCVDKQTLSGDADQENKVNADIRANTDILEQGEAKEQQSNNNDVEPNKTKNHWPGKYREYYTYCYGTKDLSEKLYEKEHIPYIELFENGTYRFKTNWFTSMALSSGTWSVDNRNENIAYLSECGGINYEIMIEKISEHEIVLRGIDRVISGSRKSTSAYGDQYIKIEDGFSGEQVKVSEYYPNCWARQYLDLLSTVNINRNQYAITASYELWDLDNVRLYDANGDNIPEFFMSASYEPTCIYTIIENKPAIIGHVCENILDMNMLKNQNTGKNNLFISTDFNGYQSLKRLDMADKNSIKFSNIYAQWYETISESETLKYHSVNNVETDEETYKKAIKDFENIHELVEKIVPYEVNFKTMDDYTEAENRLIEYIDNYIIKTGMQ